MPETVTMPKLGFDMSEGTLIRWVKSEGEAVKKGEVLAEIETDKATIEVESNYEGVLARYLVEQGSVVPVGTPIAIIGAPGEKVDVPQPATSAPVVKAEPAEKMTGGAAQIQAAVEQAPVEQEPSPTASINRDGGRVVATPLAKKVAKVSGVDISAVNGTGTGGRIVRKDVETYLASAVKAPVMVSAAVSGGQAVPVVKETSKPAEKALIPPPPVWQGAPQEVSDQVVTIDKLRAAIGRRMVEAKQQVPHFYITHEYAMEALMKLRGELNAFLPDDQKLTVNDFIVKAVALALRQFPSLNASIRGTEVIRHGAVNVGVAVAVEGGLLTVVSRDADQKPLRVISAEIRDMVSRARQGKVKPDDIQGSTFSISNLGMFDVEHFVAIINPPRSRHSGCWFCSPNSGCCQWRGESRFADERDHFCRSPGDRWRGSCAVYAGYRAIYRKPDAIDIVTTIIEGGKMRMLVYCVSEAHTVNQHALAFYGILS